MRDRKSQVTYEQNNVAGVRYGVAGPRDQPSGSLQVWRPSKDRPQPVERRVLPLSSLAELPQRLWEEVEALLHLHPLVRSSQPLFLLLVRHARTLSPMSDTLVVYIWTNMPCPVVFHRHSDILILVTSSIILAGYSFYIHLYAFSSTLPRLEVFPPNFSFWLVGSTTISSSSNGASQPPPAAATFLSHFRLQSGSALLPLGISAPTAANFKH